MGKARRNSKRHAPRRPGDDRRGRLDQLFGTSAGLRIETDPITGSSAEVRAVQPFAAQKPYRCPGCNQEIAPGVGHLVVVPLSEPDERRHWHNGCFQHRHRQPGR